MIFAPLHSPLAWCSWYAIMVISETVVSNLAVFDHVGHRLVGGEMVANSPSFRPHHSSYATHVNNIH